MFTPMGNKKYLLQKKWGLEGTPPPKTRHQSLDFTNLGTSTELEKRGESVKSGSVSGKQGGKETGVSIASSANLDKALAHVGTLGVVMNRVLESTVRYRPDKDAVVLKVFQSKNIDYDIFRNALYSTFWIQFNDEEYQALLDYFDPQHNGVVNGYDFMIAFIRLGGIRKDRMSIEVREKQELFVKQQKEEEERKKLEKEKKMELAANFNFSDDVRQRAHQKLLEAAIAFDASHPSSPSLEGFYVTTMKPYTFRELIKLTFNLKVDRDELGAILTAYDAEINETNSVINASGFLKYFLRLGIDGRHKEKAAQRHRQASMTEAAMEEQAKKAKAAAEKMLMSVDYNFTPSDELNATNKLRDASTKYDKASPGAVALDGFECESLNPGQFRDIMRQVFNIVLTNGELGFLIQKYDTKKMGALTCKPFLTDFFRLGQEQRHKLFVEQLDRQRTAIKAAHEKHLKKMFEVQNSAKLDISHDFSDMDLQSALEKLTQAAIKYDKTRGASLISFEGSHLNPLDFKKAVKRTFNLKFTPAELGATVKYFDNDENGLVNCAAFLTTFTTLGAAEKYKIRAEQLTQQREAHRLKREEDAKKVLTVGGKGSHDAEFEFTDADRTSAMNKLTLAAKKYDPNHPSAQALHGFERNAMVPAEFKELVRRTFNLRLTSPEVGAIFKIFDESEADFPLPTDQVDCGDFLKYFMSLGFAERAEVFREQLERQRRENKEREEEHRRKVEALASRGTFTVDMQFTDEDRESIMEKVNKAAFGFDKSHPAAPSLEAFEVSHMPPGLFRENLKRVFNIQATPKEIGYLMSIFDKDKVGKVDSKEFMLKFQDIGKKARAKQHSEFLDSKRAAAKAMKREAEEKLAAQYAKAELQVDYDCSSDDYQSAIEKLTVASSKYDKAHPSAPSLDGFTGGAVSPGVFRELLRRAFNVWLAPKELGAIVSRYRHDTDPNLIDGKQFLIAFMKLGFDARAIAKAQTLEKQRKAAKDRKLEEELKLHLSAQRVVLKVEDGFTSSDLDQAMTKLRAAAMRYDKNSPGCVSMEAFDAAFLTPGMFREVIKRTANLVFEPKELAAVLKEFDNGHGNVDSRRFLVQFIHWGSDERDKVKTIQLDKQRKQNYLRKTEHERKMKEAEDKMIIDVNYNYTAEERDVAFQKLTVAAKKYDKGHPGAMALDGFEEQFLKAHVFREMLKRTFGVILSAGELGAVMHYFDKKKSGTVQSKKFLIYFLKVGIAEREQDHRTSLAKLRKDEELREREHQEKLAAQWAKIELNLTAEFTPEEKASALEKLADAAIKFDPASPGPMGLTAFEAAVLSPGVFREMLKRSFNMLVTAGELAALVAEFDKTGQKSINCKEFMVRFTSIGFEGRSARKLAQLEKQRLMDAQALEEQLMKREKLSTKLNFTLDNAYSDTDLHSALEKIRVIAANYDRAHASAPSLEGFMGTNMKPHEFKDMLNRTFHVTLTSKELTALTNYFPVEEPVKPVREEGEEVDAERPKSAAKPLDVRINNRQFLNYFNKIQREEQNKRRRARIQKERDLLQKEQEYKESLLREKQQHEFSLLENTPEDELTLLHKIREAAQEYAIDPSLYNELMQGFKGPALPPNKFQELFRQIFSIRLTFPELGVLLGILDISGIGTFDGGRFLNWFYKISRAEETIMLGHSNEEITMDTLRLNVRRPQGSSNHGASGAVVAVSRDKVATAASNATGATALTGTSAPTTKSVGAITTTSSQPAKSVSSTAVQPGGSKPTTGSKVVTSPAPSASGVKTKNRYPYNFSVAEEEDDELDLEPSSAAASFSKSTLKQSWFLPSLTSAPPSTIYANNSSISTRGDVSMVSNSGDDFKYLKSIFDASVESSGSLLHSKSVGVIDSIDQKVGEHVVEKLIGPTSQQPRAGGKKGSKASTLSNVAVYGGLSASGEVPAVLANVKPVRRNIQTAPVTSNASKRRPLSPVTDGLLLAPSASIEFNHSMELKQLKHEKQQQDLKDSKKTQKTVVKPIKSKKFTKHSTAGPISPQVTELIIPTAENSHEKEVEFLHTLFSPQDVSGLLSAQPSQFNASTTSAATAGPLANNSESLLAKLDQLTQQMARRPRTKVYIKPNKVDQNIEPIAPLANPKPNKKTSMSKSLDSGTFFFPTGLTLVDSFDGKKEEKPVNDDDLYDDEGELIVKPAKVEVDERGREFDGVQPPPADAAANKPASTVLKGAPTFKKSGLLLVPKNKASDVAVDEAAAKENVDVLRQIMTSTL